MGIKEGENRNVKSVKIVAGVTAKWKSTGTKASKGICR